MNGNQMLYSDRVEVIKFNGLSRAMDIQVHVDGLVQNCSNSSALAMELLQFLH